MKPCVENDAESQESASAEISSWVLGWRAFLRDALATAPLLIRTMPTIGISILNPSFISILLKEVSPGSPSQFQLTHIHS